MKTTLEVPDSLLRRVKATAAQKGQTMAAFIKAAIEAKLQADAEAGREKPWMKFAGVFSKHSRESQRVLQAVEKECERIQTEDWE